jgi:hypothetical protein
MPMNEIMLEKADPKKLTVVTNPNDVRKDIHVFACYCRDYEIKRDSSKQRHVYLCAHRLDW